MQGSIKSATTGLTLGILAAYVTACGDPSAPRHGASTGEPRASLAAGTQTVELADITAGEAEFREVAAEVPGFGGYYRDSDGAVVIRLVDHSRRDAARAKVLAVAQRSARSRFGGATPAMRFETARYEFRELARWRDSITGPLFGIAAVTFVDVDEARNRIAIGITDPAAAVDVRRVIDNHRVAPDAFEVRHTQAPTLQQQRKFVWERFRPLLGGTDIGLQGCTLSIPAIWNGQHVLLTNSHCTAQANARDNGPTSQPTAGPRFGSEIFDRTGPSCYIGPPPGTRYSECRYADVAAYSLFGIDLLAGENAFEQGRIARTYERISGDQAMAGGQSIGVLQVDESNPLYALGEVEDPWLGDPVQKVGASTGWTYGTVNATCAHVRPAGGSATFVCQHSATVYSRGGDSGAPVFYWTGGPAVLGGILWGGIQGTTTSYFSSMRQVRREMGGTLTYYY